ncbi:MAG: S8 family serine peptidase [Bacillota bacterium]
MKRNLKMLICLVLSITLLVSGMLIFADNGMQKEDPRTAAKSEDDFKVVPICEEDPKGFEQNIDKNKDKVFDNLEKKMQEKSDSELIPVVVMFTEQPDDIKKTKVKDIVRHGKTKHEFQIIPGMSAELTKQQIKELSKLDYVMQIEYDMPVYAFNDEAAYWFGARKAVDDFGVDGDRDGNPRSYTAEDIVIAVIDTGIDANHVDLDGGKVIGWKDYVNNRTTPYDDNGHGTHCASTAAGEGDGNSNYKGVAPGAALVGVKVLDRNGSGYMSDVTAGIDWAIANKNTYGIEIISLSLGTSSSSDGTDSTSLAVNRAFDNGIVVMVAAGNSGPARYTIGSPGAAEKAITVGAMGDVGEAGFNLTYFSSRGPTADGRIKPDIAAPGYNITAAKANTSSSYVSYSGTSMATPFTAGTAALMLDANPGLTPSQIRDKLTATALDWGPSGKEVDYGFGRLDAYAAVKSAGGFSGTNIAVPDHMYTSQSLSARRKSDYWEFNVTNTSYPIAITFIMPDWSGSSKPDFDIYLYNPNGTKVASALGTKRQETINYTPTMPGTYTIRVYSYAGSGSYYFDLSTGGNSLVLTDNDI